MSKKYNPNMPFWLNRTIARTEHLLARHQAKLEALKIQQAINDINLQLKKLEEMKALYPPHKTDDNKLPCAVHIAPFPS